LRQALFLCYVNGRFGVKCLFISGLGLGSRLLTEKKQILKSASVISVITIVSRSLGYVRDQRITLLLGTSPAADAFVLAYRIPSLLRRLVGEGSMTATFIPVFTHYLATQSEEQVWDFANQLFWTLGAALAAITVLGMIFSDQVMRIFTFLSPGQGEWAQVVYLNRIMFPYIFFIGLAALAMAILNCFHTFGTPAATPILLNLSIIACSVAAVWRHFSSPAVSLAAGVLIGGTLQFLVQIPQLVRRGMHFRLSFSLRHPGVRSVARLTVPGFFGIGVAQVNFFVDTMFATARRMPTGSPTALYVAERVMELVLGGYAIAVATAILPMMSHLAAAGDFDNLKTTLGFALRIVSFITVPAAVGLIVLREPIIRVLFEHGQFVAESTNLTTLALFFYAFGVPAFAAVKLIVPAFYSAHDTRTPVRIAAYSLAINIALNIVFLRWFFPVFRNGGPAFATVLAAYFNFFALFVIFRVRYGHMGTLVIGRSFARIGLCAGIMGGLCWVGLHFSGFNAYSAFLPRLAVLLGLIVVAAGAYLGFAWLLHCDELHEVYGIAMRREPEAIGATSLVD
jgi:putative peptidoglycan lipid II flippase